MVGTDPLEVDGLLVGGGLRCPDCAGELRPWGHARWRSVRGPQETSLSRPRRSRCSGCQVTHVLLPSSRLLRRADAVAVIAAALTAKASGAGHRAIAVALGRPASTVRGWLRRFTDVASRVRVLFTGLLHALDPTAAAVVPTGSLVADAIEVIGLAAAAATRVFGPRPAWEFAAAASGGRLLAVGPVSNTS